MSSEHQSFSESATPARLHWSAVSSLANGTSNVAINRCRSISAYTGTATVFTSSRAFCSSTNNAVFYLIEQLLEYKKKLALSLTVHDKEHGGAEFHVGVSRLHDFKPDPADMTAP